MMNIKIFVYAIIMFLTAFSYQKLTAQEQEYVNFLNGGDLAAQNTFSIEDEWLQHMQATNDWYDHTGIVDYTKLFANVNAVGRIFLQYTGSENLYYAAPWSLTVDYSVIAKSSNGSILTSENASLTINYDPSYGGTYIDIAVKEYPGAHALEIEILSLTGVNDIASSGVLPSDFILKGAITVERYFILDHTIKPNITDNSDEVVNTLNWDNIIRLNWSYIEGAQEYELQYVHVSDKLISGETVTGLKDYNNASRIITAKQEFDLPMAYESGTLFYRVRAIGRHGSVFKDRLNGAWSTEGVIKIGVESSDDAPPFESNLNWTYQITHAEDGKNAHGVSFFDGSGQPRQTVGMDNENKLAIVSETMLDFEGRPAFSTMSTPMVPNGILVPNKMAFYQNFSLSPNSNQFQLVPYDKVNFDVNTKRQNPDGLSSFSGTAGSFYSAFNPMSTSGFNRHIAKATDLNNYSYAYSRTIFDDHGRVKEQGGIGTTHKIGEGHTSTYYYGRPTQKKLDRLFGTEVGYANHYRKQMVKDANGQLTVSYENLSGQVIATAFVGTEPLYDNGDQMVTPLNRTQGISGLTVASLSEHNAYDEGNNEWNITFPMLVSNAGPSAPYKFNYSLDLTNKTFSTINCPGNYNCKYEVWIKILNPDGEVVSFSFDEHINSALVATHQHDDFPILMEATNTHELLINVVFPVIGTYTIIKTLKLHNTTLDDHLAAYSLEISNIPNNCITTPSIITDCDGSITDAPGAADNPFLMDCANLLTIIKSDFEPGGQYFDNLTLNNQVPNSNWLKGALNNINPNVIIDDDVNQISLLKDILVANNVDVTGILTIDDVWDYVRDYYFHIPVQEWLKNLELYKFHPEYCHYLWCQDINTAEAVPGGPTSADFDFELMSYDATSDPNNWLPLTCQNPSTLHQIVEDDPYFASSMGDRKVNGSPNGTGRELMNFYVCDYPVGEVDGNGDPVYGYVRMWDRARDMADQANDGDPDNDNETVAETWDQFWRMYLQQKQLIIGFQKSNPCGGGEFYCPYLFDQANEEMAGDFIADFNRVSTTYKWGEIPYCLNGQASNNLHSVYTSWDQNCVPNSGGTIWDEVNDIIDEWVLPPPAGCDLSDYNKHLFVLDFRAGGFRIRVPDIYEYLANVIDGDSNDGFGDGIFGSPDPVNNFGDIINDLDPCDGGLFSIKFKEALVDFSNSNNSNLTGDEIATLIANRYSGGTIWYYNSNELPCFNGQPGGVPICSSQLPCLQSVVNGNTTYTDFESFYYDNPIFFDCVANSFNQTTTPNFTANHTFEGLLISSSEVIPEAAYLDDLGSCSRCLEFPNHPTCTYYKTPCNQVIPHCLCLDYAAADNLANTTAELQVLYETEYPSVDPSYSWTSFFTTLDNNCSIINNTQSTATAISTAIGAIEMAAPPELNCYDLEPDPCEEGQDIADYYVQQDILNQILLLAQNFSSDYTEFCLDPNFPPDDLVVEYTELEYDFTLYYYTPEGNLHATVPPEAVRPIPDDPSDQSIYNSIALKRKTGGGPNDYIVPAHRENTDRDNQMMTIYKYNSYNEIVETTMPDHIGVGLENDGKTSYGTSFYLYDQLGRIRFSQDPKQALLSKASYTKYDGLGRIVESGQFGWSQSFQNLETHVEDMSYPSNNSREQILKSHYDTPSQDQDVIAAFGLDGQKNLRQRVSYTTYVENLVEIGLSTKHASYYSYNTRGAVETILQKDFSLINPEAQIKRIEYDFGLIDGLVYRLKYQRGALDAFTHEYKYDANNRLIGTYTSRNGILRDLDAEQLYRLDGVLAREEYGTQKVQGIDYAYSLQGWIKGINSTTLNTERDIGNDGAISISDNYNKMNRWIGRDAMGYSLHYYPGDYESINGFTTTNQFYATIPTTNQEYDMFNGLVGGLYNGNISAMQTALAKPNGGELDLLLKGYRYDQKHRLKTAYSAISPDVGGSVQGSNLWTSTWNTNEYQASFGYDLNGNITHLVRNGGGGGPEAMDIMAYHYSNNTIGKIRNQLEFIGENPQDAPPQNYPNDFEGQSAGNYSYDEIGNLIGDVKEEIATIEWTVTGKVQNIIRIGGSNKPDITFRYDSNGNRIEKVMKYKDTNGNLLPQNKWDATIYVRDPQGNVLATYDRDYDIPSADGSSLNIPDPIRYIDNGETLIIGDIGLTLDNIDPTSLSELEINDLPNNDWVNQYAEVLRLKEHHLYSSKRIGVKTANRISDLTYFEGTILSSNQQFTQISNIKPKQLYPVDQRLKHELGRKYYELTNHLGNVLVVVNDKKIAFSANNTTVDYFEADVVSTTDYYPFGFEMPNRKFNGPEYRYGFNGKEKDQNNEWGSQTHYDYGFRIYNPAIGKFLSVDPLAREFPWNSAYAFAENDVIESIDLDGAERFHYLQLRKEDGSVELELIGVEDIIDNKMVLTNRGYGFLPNFIPDAVNEREEHVVHAKEDPTIPDLFYPESGKMEKSLVFNSFEEALNTPPIEFSASDNFGASFSNLIATGTMVESGGASGSGANALKGFKSFGHLRQFGTTLQAGLAKTGFKNTKLFMQGSAATGRSFKSGELFDVGRRSDFDVALVGEELFQKAASLNLVKGNRTLPIEVGSENAIKLGVNNLLEKLRKMMNRDVNIMIFNSEEAVRAKGKSVRIPTKQDF